MVRQKPPPTARQRRLGAELRRLREQAGVPAAEAAARFGVNQARISNIELGRYAVGADRVRSLARLYECSDDTLVEALAAMTGGRTRGWWEEYREILPANMLDLAELEHHASAMRVATAIHMPGLLQTREHAHALISDIVPSLAPYEVEHRVSYRIKRQVVLYGNDPTPYTAVVHEAALRMGFGGPEVAKAQLAHLLDMSERENVTVMVVPFGAHAFPGSGQAIVYAQGPVPKLDTVHLDTDAGTELLHAEPKLAKYRTVMARMESCALDPAGSRDVIRRVSREL